MRSTTVAVQHVEQERRERHPLAQPRDVGRAGGAGPGDLEGRRPPVLQHDDRLAVEHEVASGQGGHGLDHLGHALGDLVEAAGVDAHVARSPVHLHADAVELAVDDQVATADRIDGLGGGLRRGGEHRAHRPPDDQPDLLERLHASPRRQPGHFGGGAGEHHGATDDGIGHGVGLRDGGEHHAVEGALPQVAGDEVDEEALLVGGRAGHQRPELGLS